jgi:hypothetical protein
MDGAGPGRLRSHPRWPEYPGLLRDAAGDRWPFRPRRWVRGRAQHEVACRAGCPHDRDRYLQDRHPPREGGRGRASTRHRLQARERSGPSVPRGGLRLRDRFDEPHGHSRAWEGAGGGRPGAQTRRIFQFSITHPCLDVPHRRNLRDESGYTYAIKGRRLLRRKGGRGQGVALLRRMSKRE